ncbi:MAG: helix-hairpin-helix domain-containing protein [Desulfobacterales bacterium]|nr:helix-hairpin-helix domain-containing protein [Desulfobacterales bacterium]
MTKMKKSIRLIFIGVLLVVISGVFMQAGAQDKININTATAKQLTALKGIGPVISQRIVDYRNENGSFSSGKDLQQVKGVGPETMESLSDMITFSPPSD